MSYINVLRRVEITFQTSDMRMGWLYTHPRNTPWWAVIRVSYNKLPSTWWLNETDLLSHRSGDQTAVTASHSSRVVWVEVPVEDVGEVLFFCSPFLVVHSFPGLVGHHPVLASVFTWLSPLCVANFPYSHLQEQYSWVLVALG